MNEALKREVNNFLGVVNEAKTVNAIAETRKEELVSTIRIIHDKIKENSEEVDLAANAIRLLTFISERSVSASYEFIENAVNSTLRRIFDKKVRQIKIREYLRNNQYPQLEVVLLVEGGVERSLKLGSGHGLGQVVSLLCLLSLIVITKSRKILVMDEILSGCSGRTKGIISEILWAFTEIGFQFIINEHGFIPKGAKVYKIADINGVGQVVQEFIASEGKFLSDKTEVEEDIVQESIEESYESTGAGFNSVEDPLVTTLKGLTVRKIDSMGNDFSSMGDVEAI